jgi:uncharacterized protein YecE (DUF72 family)
LGYFRIDASPRTCGTRYNAAFIASLTETIRTSAGSVDLQCIVDNTASGAAIHNARGLQPLFASAVQTPETGVN